MALALTLLVSVAALPGRVALAETAATAPATTDAPPDAASPTRVVAIGDVHGAIDALRSILRATGLVDDQLRWSGGTAQLVSVGDLIDRGAGSREVLDLMMRLESEARAAGGQLHQVLGNHEVMNLLGDLRYITVAEYAGYADAPGDAERAAARDRWRGEPAAFDRTYPRGYFAHRRAFAVDGRYGRWLLSKPALVVLGDTVFVHGGIAAVVGHDVAAANAAISAVLRRIMEAGRQLRAIGFLPARGDLMHLEPIGVELEPAMAEVWAGLQRDRQSPLLLAQGPMWYRGNALCHPLIEQPLLATALQNMGVGQVVVGHTPTASRRVRGAQGGLAILADTGMLATHYRGRPYALVREAGQWSVVDAEGERTAFDPAAPPPTRLGGPVEVALANGSIEPAEAAGHGEIVEVRHGPVTVRARFVAMAPRDADRETAAYVLDRMLDLNLVPVTVRREYDNRGGVLLYWRGPWLTESQRIEQQRYRDNACQTGNDYQLVSLFDSLIRHPRPRDGYQYTASTLDLRLTGHGSAFGTDRSLLEFPAAQQPMLAPAAEARLRRLDEARLRARLPQLSARQVRALLARRDRILDTWPRLRR